MDEHDSGDITEYQVFSNIITLSPIAIPKAPPDAPSPITMQITGTALGQDKDTQITTLVNGQIVTLQRFVGHKVRLDVDGSNAYTVVLMQEGVEKIVKINGGSDSTIRILQGS